MGYIKEYEDLKSSFITAGEGRNEERGIQNDETIGQYFDVLQNRFIDLVNTKEIVVNSLASDIGYDPAVLYRICKKSRKFSINLVSTKKACYEWFNMSIQEFVSGEAAPVLLPNSLNLVAEALLLLSGKKKDNLLQQIRQVWAKEIVTVQHTNETEITIFQERYEEFCKDRYINFIEPLGQVYTSLYRISILGSLGQPIPMNRSRDLRLRTLIHLSLSSQTPIDYFCVKNYYQYLPLAFRRSLMGDGAIETIKDKTVQRILEYLISSPKEVRVKLISMILNQCLSRLPDGM